MSETMMNTEHTREAGTSDHTSMIAICLNTSDVLDTYLGQPVEPAEVPGGVRGDPYRSATGGALNETPGPRLLDADLVWMDGKEIWFELMMQPLLTRREITLVCCLAADWDLPQPLYARLDLGDVALIGEVDPQTRVIGWLARSQQVLDPKNPGRTRRPVKFSLSKIGTPDSKIQQPGIGQP